jgi:hypothetical protein
MYRQFSKPNWGSLKVLATIRPLGSFEHMFWLLDQNRSCHFAVTAQLEAASGEPTSADQLARRNDGVRQSGAP